MSTIENKIKKLEDLLATSSASLSAARFLLSEITGNEVGVVDKQKLTSMASEIGNSRRAGDEGKIVEGSFDGEKMIDAEGTTYPIPANYISKSKLVEGDGLKLTIKDDGRFLYKQIKPVERKHLLGTVTLEDGQYKVIADGKAYKLILAAVTYFKADVGSRITAVVPADGDCVWAAVESVLPDGE